MRFGSQIRSLIPWSSFHTDGNESEETGEAPSQWRREITEKKQDAAGSDFFPSPKSDLTIICRFLMLSAFASSLFVLMVGVELLLSRVSEIQVLHGGDS